MTRCVVGDDGVIDPLIQQLPGREFRTLQAGPRLVDVDEYFLASTMSNSNWGQGSAKVHSSQSARVAVRQYPAPVFNQLRPILTYSLALVDYAVGVGGGFLDEILVSSLKHQVHSIGQKI